MKLLLGTVGVFAFFGFLTLILLGYAGHGTIQDKAFKGDFDQETIDTRWANLKEVSEAQAKLIDEKKVDAALSALAKSPPAPKKSEVVVPGSPTFLKQAEQAAAPAPEEKPAAKVEDKPKVESKPEETPAPKAKAEEKPKAAPKPAPAEKAAPKADEKGQDAPKEKPKAK